MATWLHGTWTMSRNKLWKEWVDKYMHWTMRNNPSYTSLDSLVWCIQIFQILPEPNGADENKRFWPVPVQGLKSVEAMMMINQFLMSSYACAFFIILNYYGQVWLNNAKRTYNLERTEYFFEKKIVVLGLKKRLWRHGSKA